MAKGISAISEPTARRPANVTVLRPDQRARPRLPRGPARLIGREQDLAAVRGMLADGTRLLTLIGPAGAGKTSLALALAAEVQDSFADGACFVELDTVRDPDLVLAAIARAVEIGDAGAVSPADAVTDALKERQLLLVLDNFEQVVEAAPLVADLIAGCVSLVVVVTSRAALRLYDEREYPVQPLALPPSATIGADNAAPTEDDDLLIRYAAVELFVQRAQAVRPDFVLSPQNAEAVAAVCRRLDGLPLAIELAAARAKVLPPAAILERLSAEGGTGSLDVLSRGGRDRPGRSQTLRGALDWSYQLLPPQARMLLRRLSVFSGGWSLGAAETVCGDEAIPTTGVLDLLTDLVDQSLVVSDAGSAEERFRLLVTIREFGREQLTSEGELAEVQGRHIAYFTTLAEAARPELVAQRQTEWLSRLETEHDNLRAALDQSLASGDAASALRLVAALTRFWESHGHLTEGRAWAEKALAAGDAAPAELRAYALLALGQLAARQTAYPVARPALEASEVLMRDLDDRHGLATTLNLLGNVRRNQGELPAARLLYQESLAIHRELGQLRDIAIVTNNLAVNAWSEGDLPAAQDLLEQALAMQRARGDGMGTAMALVNLGVIVKERGDYPAAHRFFAECLPLFREAGDRFGVCMALRERAVLSVAEGDLAAARPLIEESLEIGEALADPRSIGSALLTLGRIDHRQGDLAAAQDRFAQAVRVWRDAGVTRSILETLDAMALLAADRGFPARATRLWGAIDTHREATGIHRLPDEQAAFDAAVAQVSDTVDEASASVLRAEGQALDLDAAVNLARSDPTESSTALPTPTAVPEPRRDIDQSAASLTPREREVLALVAGGRSNREIADVLVVSPATVHQHMINIYQKLGVHNRAQATAYAFRNGLATLAAAD